MRMAVQFKGTLVYRFYSESGELLYVGISDNPFSRFAGHQTGSEWWPDAATVEWETLPNRIAAERREQELIGSQHPLYNIIGACRGCDVCDPPPTPEELLEDAYQRQRIGERLTR